MLLMRHDDRATFRRALEDLDGGQRHAAGTIVKALRNLSVRPDLAALDSIFFLRVPLCVTWALPQYGQRPGFLSVCGTRVVR